MSALRRKGGSVPTQPGPISNARLAAELQAVALAIRIGGLDGLRSGAVKIGGEAVSRASITICRPHNTACIPT